MHESGNRKLRTCDLRHTFATRLLERGVHHFIISALLGHSTPMSGLGYASRIIPGYAHATWGAMKSAVESLEQPTQLEQGGSWQMVRKYEKQDEGEPGLGVEIAEDKNGRRPRI